MTIKNLLTSVLLLAMAFTACTQKEEPFEEEAVPSPEEVEGDFAYTFKVADPETKTTFGTDHVSWEAEDAVGSYAKTSLNKSTPVTIDGDGVHITIRSSVALAAGDKVYAYYPHSADNDKAEKTAVTLSIPDVQDNGDADAMPMVAVPFTLTGDVAAYTNTEVGTLQFFNLGSVVKFNVYSSDASRQGETIESITFNAGSAVAGSFTYDITAEEPTSFGGYDKTSVTVNGKGTVGSSKATAGSFMMVVAPGTYGGSIIVRTSGGDYVYTSGSTREYKRAFLKTFDIDLASGNWTEDTGYDTSIDSPREFLAFLAGTSASDTQTYTLSTNLDMDGYSLAGASGFGGTLDGGNHTISNLSSSSPLFLANSGTIQNLKLDASCSFTASSLIFGAIVNEDAGGTYSGITSAADVTYTAAADDSSNGFAVGGLVGYSDGGNFTGCSTTTDASVTFDATGFVTAIGAVGGIVAFGDNAVSLSSCTNNAAVTFNAKYYNGAATFKGAAGGVGVGGLIGRSLGGNTNRASSCENYGKIKVNVTGLEQNSGSGNQFFNVGGIAGRLDITEASSSVDVVSRSKNYGEIDVDFLSSTRAAVKNTTALLNVGGISGAYGTFSNCTSAGPINVTSDGTYDSDNKQTSTVGGICGRGEYNKESHANFCNVTADINIDGTCIMHVGGIYGRNGKQIGNTVKAEASITAVMAKGSGGTAEGSVGGLVGHLVGSSDWFTIKGCSVAASLRLDNKDGSETWGAGPAIGGLIGKTTGFTTANPSLVAYNGKVCSFSGSVASGTLTQSGICDRIGLIIGQTTGGTEVFGKEAEKIQVSGTILRNKTQPEISSENLADYQLRSRATAGTITIHSEYVDPNPPAIPDAVLMSFNIREGSNWSSRKGPIVSMIKDQHPHIVGLQEVKQLDYWDHLTEDHPWDYLKDQLSGYTGVRSGTLTNAFFYDPARYIVSNTGIFYLRDDYNTSGDSWDGYVRTVQYATLYDKAAGKYYFFMNTHLPLNAEGQANSMALIETRMAALNANNYPVLLMGDFNCVIGSTAFDSLKSIMNNTRYSAKSYYGSDYTNRDLYTFNNFGTDNGNLQKVDHIWVSKSVTTGYYVTLTQQIKQYGSVEYLSDHYPIIAHIS